MNKFLRASCLLTLLTPFNVFSESNATTSTPVNEALAPANFNYVLRLQDRFSLSDSTRGSAFDSFSQTLRFGLNYNYKKISASFVIQPLAGSADTGSNTQIRKALVQYHILNSGTQDLLVGAGREHLNSAVVYAPDALNLLYSTRLDNFNAGEDGLDIFYKYKLSAATLTVGGGIFNNLGVRTFTANGYLSYSTPLAMASTNSGTNFNKPAENTDRAYVAQARVEIPVGNDKIQADALYGSQEKTPMEAASLTAMSVRDVTYFEGSLGYTKKDNSLRAGLWFQDANLGKLYTRADASQVAGADYSYKLASDSSKSIEQSTYGIGFTATSALFGMSNFTGDQVGDVFTFGAGYQRLTNTINGTTFSGTTSDPIFSLAQHDIDLYNVAIGYNYSAFTLELNAVQAQSNDSVFYDTNMKQGETQATLVYLTGIIAL